MLDWDPILTWERRRLDLLDWYETNVRPRAFVDEKKVIGIAVGSLHDRLRSDRDSLVLQQSRTPSLPPSMESALHGTLQVLSPENVRVSGFRSIWSIPVDLGYEDARDRLASRTMRFVPEGSEEAFSAPDVAVLADIDTSVGALQIEFGVVSGEELAGRLASGSGSRANVFGATDILPVRLDSADLPPCSLFGEVLIYRPTTEVFTSASALLDARTHYVSLVSQLMRQIRAGL